MRLSSNGRIPRSQRGDAGSNPAGHTKQEMRGAEAAPGSHKPRDLGSIPGHATNPPGVAQQPEQRSDTPPVGGASPPPRTT